MKSNMIKMITMCMCMVVVGFAAQKGQEPVKVEQNTVIVKDQSYYDNLLNQMTNNNGDESKVVAEKANPDQAKIDYYIEQGIMRADASLNDPESCPPHADDRDTDVWLLMIDSYGDGWNGNQVCIGGSCAGLDSGSSGWASFGSLADGSYSVTCGGGSYMGEVSWEIQDCCYGVLLSGTCPYDGSLDLGAPPATCDDNEISLDLSGGSYCSEVSWDLSDGSSGSGCGTTDFCLADGDYTFNGYDSWGDGWNGNTATFTDADGNIVGSFAVEGSSGSWTITVPIPSCASGVYDCAGECDGAATEDCNGTCGGNGFLDCNGNCTTYDYWIGDGWCDSILACDEHGCDGGDCASDCAGTCNGDATEDCAGTCGGSATVDDCGECGGDGSSCSCDGEYLTVNMVDSWGDGWNGNNFCINDECATIESGASGSYTFCVDLSASNDVTCGGGSYQGEVSWTLNAEDGSEVLAGGAPYSSCLGDCGVGGCMDANADNYNADATYDDGSCNGYIGMDCDYFGYAGYILDCDAWYCVPSSWLGDGGCDSAYFACAELSCDGGDCEDCAGDCLGSAADDACGTCNGDCTESGGGCSDTDNGAVDTYGDGCAGYTQYPSWCGGYDDDDFNSGDMCCACGGGDITSGTISCGDGSCDCDGNVADCNGDCGGSAANDECGVCNGDNSSCADCCGVPNGAGDSCDGDCGACGASIPDGACDCDGNVTDCAGTCGGDAAEDNCGTCDSDSSNDCPQDCAGVFGGDSFTDCSGNCVDGWLMSYLGDGWCDGSDAPWGIDLSCYDCDNGDCSGDCGCEDDSSCLDDCGVPNGDNSSCADCAGTPNGDAELDYCGVCDGGNVANDCGDPCDDGSCDCAGVPGGDSFADCVGTCVAASYSSWIGDGYCDDGTYGIDYVSCGDFNCDNGDCGTELLEDGTCGTPDGGGSFADACADAGGFYCGDDESNWTWYSPDGCVPSNYICDGWDDCVDASDEAGCGRESNGDLSEKMRAEKAAHFAGLDSKVFIEDESRDDCGGTGPDVGCDGVCFSGLEDVGCGCGEDLNGDGCCGDESTDCSGTCGGTAIEDCSDDDCGGVGNWIGDGLCDGASQTYGYDLSCYDCDGGDCIDECGVCDGDSSSCADCCGEANGDNSSCGGSGDANGDGGLDVLDIVLTVSWILGSESADECDANEGDVDGNGTVNVLDVIASIDMILAGYTYGCTDATAPEYNADADADDGSCWTSCGGNLGWLADGWCDSGNNNAECAYDSGDCCESTCVSATYDCAASTGPCGADACLDPAGNNDNCPQPDCATSACGGWISNYTCEELVGYGYDCSLCEAEGACPEDAEGCAFDWSAYGAESCDAAWDSFGIDCATLEAVYGWNCLGCSCPGDADDGGEECVNDDSTADSWDYTCTMNGSSCYGGYYDDDDFDECSQCCACEGDASCDRGTAESKAKDLRINTDSGKKPFVVKSDANSSLGRETKTSSKFESKLQRAGSVKLIQTAEGLSYEADGFVGFEITLSHGADFEINVTKAGYIASSRTDGNTTKVLVVNNENSELFSSTGDFEIVDVIAGTTGGTALTADIIVGPKEFGLSGAYPNPFNPATSFELSMSQEGFVSVKVYNLMGQVVATLHEGNLTATSHSFTWNASDVASGMYFLKAETAVNVDIQKIMFMK